MKIELQVLGRRKESSLNLSISATEQGKVDASLLKTWSSKWHGSNELFLASPPL